MSDREQMQYDVVIVGAGPAGLACALRLKQLKADLSICVLEKGSTVGAHSLSGAVWNRGRWMSLLPDWRASYTGMAVAAQHDEFMFLTAQARGAAAAAADDAQSRQCHRVAGAADRVACQPRGRRGDRRVSGICRRGALI
jgi:cation diffusion facilitator CzcD-associated flavoprotein CzcO